MDKDSETTPLVGSADAEGIVKGGARGFSIRHAVIVPYLICYFFAYGIYAYALPEFTQETLKRAIINGTSNATESLPANGTCHGDKSSPEHGAFNKVQQQTAIWTIYYSLASSVPALFGSIIWGTYSDVLGRRFLFIMLTSGLVVKLTVLTLVVRFETSLVFLILGNVAEGLTGSFTTLFAVTFSFVADITNPGRTRTIFIVLIELVVGVTITAATFSTGYFIQSRGFFFPVLTSCILSVTCLFCVIFLMPETLKKRPRIDDRKSFIVYIGSAFNFYCRQESGVKRKKYILLILAFLFVAIPAMNRGSLETVYQLGEPFCWSPQKIGWFGAMKTGLASLFGIGAVFVLQRFISDDTIGVIGTISGIGSLVVEGLARTNAVLYTVPALASLSYIPLPMIRSLMSHLTPADQQGALFASIGAVETLCSLLGSLTNNVVYAATVALMNGFVFFISALFSLLGMIFLSVFMYVVRRTPDERLMIEKIIPKPSAVVNEIGDVQS